MSNLPSNLQLRPLTADDDEAFSALRRLVTADNPVPMGLTLEEELSRPMQGFRDQLSYPAPNAAFGAFADDKLVGTAAVAWPSKMASSRHKTTLWGTFAHAQDNSVRRVNLLVYLPNEPAIGLYQSLGFVACAMEPEAICIAGTFHDGQSMSLLLSAT